MEGIQVIFVLVAALCAIYLSGQGPQMIRKCNEILTGKSGCAPVDDIDFVTLHYFSGRGRGEMIRMMLEDAQIPYNQTNFNKDTWPAAKVKGLESGLYPLGQVPAIETSSGIELAQSIAILHYLGRSAGMDCDCHESQTCEALALIAEDVRSKLNDVLYDPDYSLDTRENYLKNVAPIWLGYLEKLAPPLQGKTAAFFIGNRITWVDFIVFNTLDVNVEFGMHDVGRPPVPVLDQFPKLESFYNFFKQRPRIANYLKSDRRPAYKGPMPKGMPTKTQGE